MFTIRLKTTAYRPDLQVTIRNSVDGWETDLPGIYENDEWQFVLDEGHYAPDFSFKFVLEQAYWMEGQDLALSPVSGGNYVYDETHVRFPRITEAIVENGTVQQRFFTPNLDQAQLYDVVVIGSGIGGGIVADQLSDLGLDVLVLEAGSYLFPVHVANLPRQHKVGQFDKHVWDLWDEFQVRNYVNAHDSQFDGAQAFNLGGRSLFWGGLIPRMSWWEMETWPTPIRWYLEDRGYQHAEDLMNCVPVTPSAYHVRMKRFFRNQFPAYGYFDAPLALQATTLDRGTIPAGMFSTADLLMESRLTDDRTGKHHLTINLNHPVVRLETANGAIKRVVAHDLIADTERSFQGKHVVLAAGTIESAKIAQMSNLQDTDNRIGVGITDHPIFFTHFAVPTTSPYHQADGASKILAQHKEASTDKHPYNVVIELGADLNQGRYVDKDILERHRQLKGNYMLCEIVFLFNAGLVDMNHMNHAGAPHVKPVVTMGPSSSADAFIGEITALKDQVIQQLKGEALDGSTLDLKRATLGGVGHEVGTLRLGADNMPRVVDTDLKFVGYNNLYVCDLSVFPSSPAANPTLTLAALAVRLAEHIKGQA